MKVSLFVFLSILFYSCSNSDERIRPEIQPISQSVYASGVLKSDGQYQAYATVNGIIAEIFVSEGDTVKKGEPILRVSDKVQKLNAENARLAADYNDLSANKERLNEAASLIDLSRSKMKTDSSVYFRQKNLWDQQVGSKNELDQRELAYLNSKNAYANSIIRYNELKRQLNYAASQAKRNLSISQTLSSDFVLRSEMDGIVYNINRSVGEIVGPQTSLAVIGSAKDFILEMQIDENDILLVKTGMKVLVKLDSYKGRVYEAVLTKINPLMNERTQTFTVEAKFVQRPERLYPNTTFEASILIQTKERALLIPRKYVFKDSLVLKSNGDTQMVRIGLQDYRKVEILEGLQETDELILPEQ